MQISARRSSIRKIKRTAFLVVFFAPFLSSHSLALDVEPKPVLQQPANIRLGSSKPATLELRVDNSQGGQLLIREDEPLLEFRVVSELGQEVRSLSAGYSGWILMSFRSSQGNHFHLKIQSRQTLESPVNVFVELRPGPSSTHDLVLEMAAEQLFSAAQSLRVEPTATALRKAISLYQRAANEWSISRNQTGQALAMAAEAETLLDLSDDYAALKVYSSAGSLIKQDNATEVSILNGEARVYLDLWKREDALKCAQQALALSRAIRDSWGEADALANIGYARMLISGRAEMNPELQQALDLAEKNNNRLALARALCITAWIERDLGHVSKSTISMNRSEALFQQTGDFRGLLGEMIDLAVDENLRGDVYPAVVHHLTLLPILKEAGHKTNEANVATAIGLDYLGLNRPREALDYFKLSYRILAASNNGWNERASLELICSTDLDLHLWKDAERYCHQSQDLAARTKVPIYEADAALHLGMLAEAQNHNQTALVYFDLASRLSAGFPQSEATIGINRGMLLFGRGSYLEALTSFSTALALSHSAEDNAGIIEAHYQIARTYAQLIRLEDAKTELDKALDLFETQRLKVHDEKLRTSYFTAAKKCYDLYVDILMQQHATGQALEKSEAARARTLLDSVVARSTSPPVPHQTQSTSELTRLRADLNSAYEARLNLIVRGKNDQEIRKNAEDIRRLATAYDQANDLEKDQTQATEFAAKPLSASELVDAAPKDSVVLEYMLGDKQSYLWTIKQGQITSTVLPGRQTITTEVEKWRKLLGARQRLTNESFAAYRDRVQSADRQLPQQSSKLSCMLLGGLQPTDGNELIVIPDGVLQSLPFAALPLDGCNNANGAPLLTTYEVVAAPSLSVLKAGASANSVASSFFGDVAILADPVFSASDPRVSKHSSAAKKITISPLTSALRDVGYGAELPRLSATRQEAQAIASAIPSARVLLATDFNANLTTALSTQLSQYRIWHFATHGLMDSKSPELSGIVFSLVDPSGLPIPGYLKTQDIFDLSIRTDLVVLSACNSGLGEQIDGEGTVGLSYAFLRAGAKQVVSTLWNVDDQASSDLMAAFYRGLLSESLSPSAALQKAQRAMLLRKHNSEPFYWAGYVLNSN